MLKSYIWSYEDFLKRKCPASSLLYDLNIMQSITIFDLNGFNLGLWNKKTINILKQIAKMSSDYYPEVLHKLFICNAPMVFTGVFTLIKAWLDETTKKKIQVLGSNYFGKLSECIDDDQIPTFLGGKNETRGIDEVGPWIEYELIDSPN